MGYKKFPKITFGPCPQCGGGGGDDPNPNLGTDAPPRDTVGNGYKLEYWRGGYWCELCKKEQLAREESELDSENQADEQEFRDRAGFTREVT